MKLLLYQALVVAHDEMRVDFIDQIKHDADRNEEARAAEEARKTVTNMQRIRNERRNNRDDRKERRADIRDTKHDFFEIIRRAAPGTISLNERAASLEIIRHILRIEGNCRPEVAEEVNQHDVKEDIRKRTTAAENIVSFTNEGRPPGRFRDGIAR